MDSLPLVSADTVVHPSPVSRTRGVHPRVETVKYYVRTSFNNLQDAETKRQVFTLEDYRGSRAVTMSSPEVNCGR